MRCNVFLICILSICFHQAEISTALTFNELFKSGILELDNNSENYYNYNGAVSQYKLVSTKIYFFSKLSELGTDNRRKRKNEEEKR